MEWRDRRVLITGLSGFVGSYLGEHLVERGARVYGIVRRRADGDVPRNIRFHNLEGCVTLLTGDLLDSASLVDALDDSQPDVIFHLAAQSFVPRSFQYPNETYGANFSGTLNLLEAIRLRRLTPTFIFAGSSEEYGLVFASEQQHLSFVSRHGEVFPDPACIPELPIRESNPLRPMSPYGVTKVQGDYMTRNYSLCWGIPAVVSRAFNHEGSGRGSMFVTSIIASQVARIASGVEDPKVVIGNVNSLRDWSHIDDMVKGYCLLAEKGRPGEVYNQGSQRTNSILTFILLALEEIGSKVEKIETFKNGKKVLDPLDKDDDPTWGCVFDKTKLDSLILNEELSFELEDEGIWVDTGSGRIPIYFDSKRFRALEVPILLAETSRVRQLGFEVQHSLADIVRDQVNYFLNSDPSHNGGAGVGPNSRSSSE